MKWLQHCETVLRLQPFLHCIHDVKVLTGSNLLPVMQQIMLSPELLPCPYEHS